MYERMKKRHFLSTTFLAFRRDRAKRHPLKGPSFTLWRTRLKFALIIVNILLSEIMQHKNILILGFSVKKGPLSGSIKGSIYTFENKAEICFGECCTEGCLSYTT